jgi:hypothetical protein
VTRGRVQSIAGGHHALSLVWVAKNIKQTRDQAGS